MNPVKIILIIFSLGLGMFCMASWHFSDIRHMRVKFQTHFIFPQPFASVRINSHQEKELRISYKNVLAIETTWHYLPVHDLVFRQVTDGRLLFQVVFQGGVLKECDYTSDSDRILDLISSFISPLDDDTPDFGDIFTAYTTVNSSSKRNVTLAYFSFEDIQTLKQFSEIVNLHSLHSECRHFLETAMSAAEQEAQSRNFTDIYADILNNTDMDKLSEFNKHFATATFASHSQNSGIFTNPLAHRISKRSQTDPSKQRSQIDPSKPRLKRAAFDFNSVLIFPGTKWCGKGDLARCYEDLGDDQELDMCCRDHDCCPFVIPPFTQKFNTFNYRFHSLLHCDCDQRFRGCLQQSESTMANMIGKIYFNILGSKCFEFQQLEVCAERSWWGRCLSYDQQVAAVMKPQVSFFEGEMANTIKEHDTAIKNEQ